MGASDLNGDLTVRAATRFATTHWSLVLAAADSASPQARQALETLCRTYWYPLYAFVRLKGHATEDAKDLTQAFFERFLQKHTIKQIARERGRFRSFLLTAVQHYLCDQFDRATAAKRGGGMPVVALDIAQAEALLGQAGDSPHSAESTYDQAWARTVAQAGLEQLRARYEAEGKASQFAELKAYLSRPADRADYTATAARLGISADAVAMAVVRLRREYRAAVRAEVANTVATPAEIDEEMRYLVNLLAADPTTLEPKSAPAG